MQIGRRLFTQQGLSLGLCFGLGFGIPAAAQPEPARAAAQRLRLVYADYRPFSWMNGDKPAGIEVDIAKELFARRLGFELEHRILPWARAQSDVASGDADAFFATATPQRLQFAVPTGPALLHWQMTAFARRSDPAFAKRSELAMAQLCQFKLAAVRGNGWVKTHLACAERVAASSNTESLLRMLMLERFDLILEDRLVVRSMARQLQLDEQIKEIRVDSEAAPMTLMIGRRSPSLLEQAPRIEAALNAMSRDGALQRILREHVGAPF
ncbi:transporter substrate-binding domain-containing protein [Paucibacter sp. AS339]|uniref:substrate-binding periplasmic protein n=1 Tax=Paucibacter hankyongi TaxID=3133434 RepID=UPI0030AFC7B9